jgi:hypothetical protein
MLEEDELSFVGRKICDLREERIRLEGFLESEKEAVAQEISKAKAKVDATKSNSRICN